MNTYTAAEISRASGSISRQGVAKLLAGIKPDTLRDVRGNKETSAWQFNSFPPALRERLEADARRQKFRNAETLLATPPGRWSPAVPLRDVAEDELNDAAKLRDVLTPFLRDQSRPAADRDALIAARYGDASGHVITADYARKLYQRTLDRDAGVGDYGRLEIYLSESPRQKAAPQWTPDTSNLADMLPALESRLAGITTPANPPEPVVRSVWHVAFEEYSRLVSDGAPEYRAARIVREFLHARAPFMPRNRDALLKSWNNKLPRWLVLEGMPGALGDLRGDNGRKIEVAEADVALLQHSIMTKNSGKTRAGAIYARIDSAWREEYPRFSEATRKLGKREGRCPRVVVRALNRVAVTGLAARRHGKRTLEELLGRTKCNRATLPSMHTWVADDLTGNLELASKNPDGSTSLFQPQIIAVMDVHSGKYVGWSGSQDKGPTSELVWEAFCDAVRRTGKIPHRMGLENGWTFGRSNCINGKYNESGEVIIAGLAEFGCEVFHFKPANPTSKGEIEKGFDLLQRRMERHPGYTGRIQRLDAPEQFRREQIEMRRKINPRDPATCRYDFPQGMRVIGKIINEHNATIQRCSLAGRSPDQAFLEDQDHENPAICLSPRLQWMLFPKRRVTIKHNGVGPFQLFGIEVRVRGGNLASPERIGREYWAVVDNRAADCVTFMSLNFDDVFTEPLRPIVDKYQSQTNPQSDALETEYRTKAEHRRVVEDQYQGLIARFGDPRSELLQQAQAESRATGRIPLIDPNHAAAGAEGERQRAELRKKSRRAKTVDGSTQSDARPGYDAARKSIFQNQEQPE